MSAPSKKQLKQMLRERLQKTIPEGTGAEIKNLCDALYTLEGKDRKEPNHGPKELTVRFEGDADEYGM